MADSSNNDNDVATLPKDNDDLGHAALLLVESLIHGLIERSIISVAKAVEIVEVATDVKRGIAADLNENPAITERSIAALEAISKSLSHDLPAS